MIEVNYNDYKRILEENMRLIPENHKLKEEVERLNNIINELEKYINEQIERSDYTRLDTFDEVYDYLQELKESDKE